METQGESEGQERNQERVVSTDQVVSRRREGLAVSEQVQPAQF